jgi:DNA mismatch endonuclease Vsr
MDKLNTEQRRKNMQAVRSKGSKIESALAKKLFASGFRYRKNNKTVYGRPDMTFKKLKIAIFADSEFWHGFDWNNKKNEIKSNRDFWIKKIERNIERDKEVNLKLKSEGWSILRFWGKEIKKDIDGCVEKIVREIEKKKNGKKENRNPKNN